MKFKMQRLWKEIKQKSSANMASNDQRVTIVVVWQTEEYGTGTRKEEYLKTASKKTAAES